MSYSVGDEKIDVSKNRDKYYLELGLTSEKIACEKQIHSDIVTIVDKSGCAGESDALITNVKNLGLAISSADCTTIFIYDKKENVIAGVH